MAKKIVIANWGIGEIGKTTTLKMVYEALKKKYDKKNIPIISNGDIKAIISATIKGKIVKIGIETQGDPGSRIFKSIDDFLEAKCDIIIVACRTRGKTTEKVTSLEQKGYEIIWFPHYQAPKKSLEQEYNEKYVKEVLKTISSRC